MRAQVSNYLSFTKEDHDEEKKAELAGVVAPGDKVFVKVGTVTRTLRGSKSLTLGCFGLCVAQPRMSCVGPFH